MRHIHELSRVKESYIGKMKDFNKLKKAYRKEQDRFMG